MGGGCVGKQYRGGLHKIHKNSGLGTLTPMLAVYSKVIS